MIKKTPKNQIFGKKPSPRTGRKNRDQKTTAKNGQICDPIFFQKTRLSTLFGQKTVFLETKVVQKNTKKAPETGFLVKNT